MIDGEESWCRVGQEGEFGSGVLVVDHRYPGGWRHGDHFPELPWVGFGCERSVYGWDEEEA